MTDRNIKLDTICTDWRQRSIWKLEPAEQARILRSQTTEKEQNLLMTIGLRRYALLYPPVVVRPSGTLIDITKNRLEKNASAREVKRVVVQKAKAFDKIIERLDYQWVGGKLLRDCTRADLLRAGQNNAGSENKLSINRTLYIELAAFLKGSETVSEARVRGEVRKLLEHHYVEET